MSYLNTFRKATFFYKLMALLLPFNFIIYCWMVIDYLTHPLATGIYGPEMMATPIARALFVLLLSPLLMLIGLLIMRRVPGNAVGVLILLLGLGAPSFGIRQGADPLWVALQSFYVIVWWMSLIYLVLYFPDGQAYPRWANRLFSAIMVFQLGSFVFINLNQPVLNTLGPPINNPLLVPTLTPISDFANQIAGILVLPLIVGVLVSPILRFRATIPGTRERQQIKWLAFCAMVFAGSLLIYLYFGFIGDRSSLVASLFQGFYILFVSAFPPITLGSAILRHKLYDIDIIIRRTLVYAILTGILALIYFGGIVLAQQVFRLVTGQTSDLAIVISTLLIAALFTPMRRRVQDVIDRRLYRRKYDAEKTLQRFNATLRDEVNLDELKQALTGVVDDTMQPARLALWVPENPHKEPK
jgi:hypothetical protein